MEENKVAMEAQEAPEVQVEETPAKETGKSVLNASVAPEAFDWDAFEK